MNAAEVLLAMLLLAGVFIAVVWGVSRAAYARGAEDALADSDSYRFERQEERNRAVDAEAEAQRSGDDWVVGDLADEGMNR
ncbi:hypothetical protein [Mycolicibacterium bacteremicum]|nr:hypothetical protein [Mycolicibacterium bacteremicum]MCV7434856.1 hypothetical protein [Mycolicibacterium bacteremicum]